MSFTTSMLMVKSTMAIIIITISMFGFVALVGGYMGRDVASDDLEMSLFREYVTKTFASKGITNKKDWESIVNLEDQTFSVNIKLGDNNYVSNARLYDFKDLCGIDGTFVKCSPDFNDFYLVDGKFEKVTLNVVMKLV